VIWFRQLRGNRGAIQIGIAGRFFVSQDFNGSGNFIAKVGRGCRMPMVPPSIAAVVFAQKRWRSMGKSSAFALQHRP
jgi:hypothetical protein